MGIRWDNLMETERRQFEAMGETDRFVKFLLMQQGAPYGWGNETPRASDCSGAVCMALRAATGLLVRTTADDLMRRVFTRPNPGPGDIRAAFFTTKKARKHGDRTVAAGTATHVAGFVGDNTVMNSEQPAARVRPMSDVSHWYLRNGHEAEVRGLDRAALERLAKAGAVWGLDEEFRRYFYEEGAEAPAARAEEEANPGAACEEAGEAAPGASGGAAAGWLFRAKKILLKLLRLLLAAKARGFAYV